MSPRFFDRESYAKIKPATAGFLLPAPYLPRTMTPPVSGRINRGPRPADHRAEAPPVSEQLALFRVPPPIKVNRLIFNAETRSERLGPVCVQAGAWAMFFTNNHIKFDIGIILVYIRIYLLGSPDGCFVVREHGCAEIEA